MANRFWWRDAVIYEIYVRSFKDADGDGVGDLPGVIEKLPYLSDLGVDAIWLTPFYESPGVDNGYDISDYESVDPLFGTNEDFARLVDEAHARGIRVITDIVVNHTSDRHPWFLDSRSSRTSAKRDWYIWRDEPNNWGSQFDGSAWHYDETTGQYYLGLFSAAQPDLNWKNPAVREAVYAMMERWANRGVDGFRLDVISLLAKPDVFLDGPVDSSGYGAWHEQVANAPMVHEYIHGMYERVFGPYGLMTVGEASGVTLEEAKKYSAAEREELSMVFQFEHVGLDGSESYKWTHGHIPVEALKDVLTRWQLGLRDCGWNGLFWCNHDQPRIVSRLGSEGALRERSAKMLAACLFGMRGTPFVYQGQELGMTNVHFTAREQFRDIESLDGYQALLDRGVPEDEVLEIISQKSRDNARTPMQWDSSEGAGFTTGEPWIMVNENFREINAAEQMHRPDSVYAFYKEIIRLRHENACLREGAFVPVRDTPQGVFVYQRVLGSTALTVVCNFTDRAVAYPLPAGHLLLGNVPERPSSSGSTLLPFEALLVECSL